MNSLRSDVSVETLWATYKSTGDLELRNRLVLHYSPLVKYVAGRVRSKANRELLRRRGIEAVIPERSDQEANRKRRGRNGGRPVALDKEAYKRRNVVERSFNTFKQWRAIATRYDKLALTYRGGVVLRAIVIWLRELGDTP